MDSAICNLLVHAIQTQYLLQGVDAALSFSCSKRALIHLGHTYNPPQKFTKGIQSFNVKTMRHGLNGHKFGVQKFATEAIRMIKQKIRRTLSKLRTISVFEPLEC